MGKMKNGKYCFSPDERRAFDEMNSMAGIKPYEQKIFERFGYCYFGLLLLASIISGKDFHFYFLGLSFGCAILTAFIYPFLYDLIHDRKPRYIATTIVYFIMVGILYFFYKPEYLN